MEFFEFFYNFCLTESRYMYIKLIRNEPQGNAITGRLIIDGRWFCNTLERKGYEILALCYHVTVTMSPKFRRLLPLVTGVPRSIVQNGVAVVQNGVELSSAEKTPPHHATPPLHKATPCAMRSGIRFHRGSKPEHSTGCILVLGDNWRSVESCRMVQSGVESYSAGITMLPNSTQPLHNATQPLHNSTPPQGRTAAEVEQELTRLILKTQNDHEEIILEVIDYRPDTDAGYDIPCPLELQQHKIDERRAAKRLSQLFREFASDTQRPTT